MKKKININYEILFVDDFSNDETKKIINKISKQKKNIFLIENIKQGLGESVKKWNLS